MSRRNIKDEDLSEMPSKKRARLEKVEENNSNAANTHDFYSSEVSLTTSIVNNSAFATQTLTPVELQRIVKKIAEGKIRSGAIKKISLKNFMCHGNFEVVLNKNVNLFVGDNGSGKSAILAALAIGLGCKASATSRSTNLKDLVKRGEPQAVIEIVLCNDGLDSFEEETYGDEVTIVRTISVNGATSYKLKNSKGVVISTSRSDLQKLTLVMNIQVDNPVLILNQDASRSFLKECDPKKLYQFFLKATQIEAIIEKLNACFASASSSKTQLANMLKTMKVVEKELDVLEKKYVRLKSVDKIKMEITRFKNQLDWVRVSVVELELKKCEETKAVMNTEVAELNDLVNNRQEFEIQFRQELDELRIQFDELKQQVQAKNVEYENERKKALNEQEKIATVHTSCKRLESRLERCQNEIVQLETGIREKDENPDHVLNLQRANERKLKEIYELKNVLAGRLENAKRDVQMLSNNLDNEKAALGLCIGKKTNLDQKFSQLQSRIKQMDMSQKDNLSVYGENMPRCIQQIEALFKAGKFTEMPRGPLGRYIEIPDKKWKSAVENILGGIVTAFFVCCDKDRITLSQLLSREFRDIAKSQIITGKYQNTLYDTSQGRVQTSDANILMDLIRVNDPVVMNCLIDQRGIESILFVADTDQAIHFTSEDQNIPRNLQKVILLHPFSEYFPSPNYRTYALKLKPARFLQTDLRELKEQFEEEKKEVIQKLEQMEMEHRKLLHLKKENEKNLHEKQEIVKSILLKEGNNTQEIEKLKNVEYPPENEYDILCAELVELKKTLEKFSVQLSEETAKKEDTIRVVRSHEATMKTHKLEMKRIETDMNNVQKKLATGKSKLNELNTNFKLKTDQREKCMDELKQLTTLGENLEKKIGEMVGSTQNERMNCTRSEEELLKSIDDGQRQISRIQKANENFEDVEMEMINKQEYMHKLTNIHKVFDDAYQKLTTARDQRFKLVWSMKSHMGLKLKHKFHSLMALRNYTAEIDIKHQDATLELKVVPRDNGITDAVSNTKSLSGGERSFSTVAFLISLWSCVGHPFYFLDEYDVFSDEYNKHIMTMLLFDEAQKNKDKQYGFLTPQDVTNISASETITIHKLLDPTRC